MKHLANLLEATSFVIFESFTRFDGSPKTGGGPKRFLGFFFSAFLPHS